MKRLGTVFFFLLIAGLCMGAAAPAVLKIKSYLKIDSGDKIYMHQLVDGAAVAPNIMEQLRKIVLGSAPALGERRIFSNKAIAEAVRAHAPLRDVNLIIPNQVVVENRGYELSEDAVTNELTARWRALCSECQIEIKNIRLPLLPAQLRNRPWTIENDQRLPKGYFTQKLLVTQENGMNQIFWLNGEMSVRKLVPVAARSLAMGQRLTAEDFRWEWRDVTLANDGLPNEKGIVGQRVRLPMSAGDILFAGHLEREKAVRRGEIVHVTTGDGDWQVTLEAVTEQDGYIGDIVNVRNRQSNKVVSAEVVARGKVVVR